MKLERKFRTFKNVKQLTKRINMVEKWKKAFIKKGDLGRARWINASLSEMKKMRRNWRKYITSVEIFTV